MKHKYVTNLPQKLRYAFHMLFRYITIPFAIIGCPQNFTGKIVATVQWLPSYRDSVDQPSGIPALIASTRFQCRAGHISITGAFFNCPFVITTASILHVLTPVFVPLFLKSSLWLYSA